MENADNPIIPESENQQQVSSVTDKAQKTSSTNKNVSTTREMNNWDWKLRNAIFRETTVKDQDNYYVRTAEKNIVAARQVNQIRAALSFSTGAASALILFITQTNSILSPAMDTFVRILIVLSVALPAIAGGFNALADLYQWDRTTRIYRTARNVLKFSRSREPIEAENGGNDTDYRPALKLYSASVLKVMEDEQAQWGLNIRVPKQNEEFVKQQEAKIKELEKTIEELRNPNR